MSTSLFLYKSMSLITFSRDWVDLESVEDEVKEISKYKTHNIDIAKY